MKALLFGSISTLADTSELRRAAFNAAFKEHGLDWTWEREPYREMVRVSGGARRIREQAAQQGRDVDADAVHATKSRIYQAWLADGRAEARPGVRDLIARCRHDAIPVGFVTTTTPENVAAMLSALGIDRESLAVVTTIADVTHAKPASDCYDLALRMLALDAAGVQAIEDNADGVRAALAAGIPCIAWPNENTRDQDFSGARIVDGSIDAAVSAATVA